jgi:hypothetical protein
MEDPVPGVPCANSDCAARPMLADKNTAVKIRFLVFKPIRSSCQEIEPGLERSQVKCQSEGRAAVTIERADFVVK